MSTDDQVESLDNRILTLYNNIQTLLGFKVFNKDKVYDLDTKQTYSLNEMEKEYSKKSLDLIEEITDLGVYPDYRERLIELNGLLNTFNNLDQSSEENIKKAECIRKNMQNAIKYN